ncbi:MAG: response regulator [Pseudomonadales bacterium]|nr:response regulator [Pseudomonadales bacterium]
MVFFIAIALDLSERLFIFGLPAWVMWLFLLVAIVLLLVASFARKEVDDNRVEYYNKLLKAMNGSHLVIARQRIIAVSNAFIKFPGAPEQLLGCHVWNLWGDSVLQGYPYQKLLERLRLDPQLSQSFDYDGQVNAGLKIDLTISVIDYEREEFLLALSDAGPRVESLRRIEEDTLLLRRAKEIANLGYWNINVNDPNATFNATGIEEMFGTRSVELDAWWQLIHPNDASKIRQLIANASDHGVEPEEYTFRIIRTDGEIRHLRAKIGILKSDEGQVLRLVGVIQDVTDIIRSEERLRHAQKMEAVGELTGGLSHDFNNLLHVVLGNVDLIESETEEDLESIRAIRRAAERGSELTQRLLAFSRRQILDPKVVNANDCVAHMLPLLRRTLDESINVESKLATSLHNCNIDSGQLENSILNLAINAQHSMPAGGKLTIETKNTYLDEAYVLRQEDVCAGSYVQVSIKDTGSGMSEKILGRVFEPFFTTKDVGKGSGLGLSMVYGFIKQSGGHVDIESEIDCGTTVNLFLPFCKDGLLVQAGPEHVDNTRFFGKVLLVEDDEEVAHLTRKLLKSVGYTVFSAREAGEAIEILSDHSDFVLLLSDVVLPGAINGPDLARQVADVLPEIKVLFMSGYAEDAIAHHGVVDEGIVLLQKPFRKSEMVQKLQQVFAH